MSKFSVGDRVVVVDSERSFFLARGEVVAVTEASLWPYTVKLPDEVWEEPVVYSASELEFEHVYDELSKKPCADNPMCQCGCDEDSSVGPEVDTRLEGEAGPELVNFPDDAVNHPSHYTSHPSGVECIEITRHMGFLDGNAMKYLWRFSLKNGVEDLYKCRQYLDWLIEAEEAKRG